MPLATITDWSNGPMGPGWFLLFQGNRDIFYDGGGMHELIDAPVTDDRRKRLDEIFALIMLMREQC